MNPRRPLSQTYDVRIERAGQLINAGSSARELLQFYRHLAGFQKNLLEAGQTANGGRSPGGSAALREKLDLAYLLPHFSDLLSLVKRVGPNGLASAAEDLASAPADSWVTALSEYWIHGGRAQRQADEVSEFFLRVILQPVAEQIAARTISTGATGASRVCPLCSSLPVLGVLRAEGDGGKRFLMCSLCSLEWEFRRLLCANCGEEDESKLPVYIAEQLPHIRVESCDTCKTFVRTINLTKDGRAAPLVDDLAAISLTLWAHEHGYTRLRANVLGS